jgi:Acetyltransferase (isoleucine patch superfamily)
MDKLKIPMLSVIFIVKIIFLSLKKLFRHVYTMAYFRVKKDSYVNSYLVSFHSNFGKKVWVDQGVRIFKDVKIGDYTCINKDALLESGRIGKFCSIAANVAIGCGEHPLQYISTNVATYENTSFGLIDHVKGFGQKKDPPIIGNDVWIARDAIILRGVNVGNGAVIAANAVVTKDVSPYAIVAGVPAKVINYRFEKDVIEKLQRTEWWDDEEFIEHEFRNTITDINEILSSIKK